MSEEPAWLAGIAGEDARALICSDQKLIRVVAGPGAGKTTCLKRRSARLIDGGLPPDRIFVGTFTRAIAKGLRNDLHEEMEVSTIHSLAYRLLRENPTACQGMRLRFLLDFETDCMLYDIAGAVPGCVNHNSRQNELKRLQSAREQRQEVQDAVFAGAVRAWLVRHGGMLVNEVVYLALTGLESHDIQPGEFDHVVVDEYQDLTAAEQELVERVWSQAGSLVVMGDNDQSIYSFRFNHPEGINEFVNRWAGVQLDDLTLPENRRCGEQILDLANLMMAEAGATKPPMVAASGRPGDVSFVQWPGLEDEIAGLADHIQSRPDETFLVLVPRRFIGYRLRDAIGDDAITAFTEEALEHPLTQERFTLGSVLANPNDSVALRVWLGFQGGASDQAPSRNAEAYASLGGVGPTLGVLEGVASGRIRVAGAGSRSLRGRCQDILQSMQNYEQLQLSEKIDAIFDPQLASHITDDEQRALVHRNLTLLRNAAHRLRLANNEATLATVMDGLRYTIASRTSLLPDDDQDAPRVQIMTLHSAKGLEADNVVVAGLSDEVLPGTTEDAALIEEQRRLVYVAVTRAKNDLVVSWHRSLPYADARSNHVRITRVTTQGTVRRAHSGRSRLLPQGISGVQVGATWLQRQAT